MSYGITAYSAPVDEINALFGSLDEAVKSEVRAATKEDLDSNDQYFDGTPMAKFLDDFFSGTVSYPDEAFKYWYLFEALCGHFGTLLDNSEWYPARGAYDELCDISACRMFPVYTTPSVPSPDDFPMVWMYRHGDLDEAAKEIGDCDDFSEEQISQFQEWLQQCKASNRDLVLFYY